MKRIWAFIILCIMIFCGFNWEPSDRIENRLPFVFEVARGAVPGVSFERKFGAIDDVDAGSPYDVWKFGSTSGANEYTWSDTADIDRVSSSSALDTHSVRVTGLDADGYEVIQSVILTGQTPVALTTPLWRVNRVDNDNSEDYAGNIYVFVNGATSGGVPSDVTSVRGFIAVGDNQTLQTVYTVPKGKIAYVLGSEVAIIKGLGTTTSVSYKTKLREPGGVFKVKYNYSLASAGTSRSTHNAPMWIPVPELTDIKPEITVTADNTGVSYAFTVLLVNN